MQILAYGEDALTLWALQTQVSTILGQLRQAKLDKCTALFQPSFGRKGGPKGAEFGEFDFILLSQSIIYLGESKWDKSPERPREGVITLRGEQQLRHVLFEFYWTEWKAGKHTHLTKWDDFLIAATPNLLAKNIGKPLAPAKSTLAKNLANTFEVIDQHFRVNGDPDITPKVVNLLLYFYQQNTPPPIIQNVDYEVVTNSTGKTTQRWQGVKVVTIPYPQHKSGSFIELK